MQKVFFKTFGCRTNIFDTSVMIQKLKDFEYTADEKEAHIIVINSCTVTNSADSTVRSYINYTKKLPLKPRIVFTGCGVWTKGERLFEQKKVDALFGHSEKEHINTLLQNKQRFFQAGDLHHLDETIVDSFAGKSRAFIKIQEGCDFRCNYCVIPYVRGDARSYKVEHILQQISRLASNGFGEFILTGTNIGSYGKKEKSSLAKLLKQISMIRGVRRIRLGSVEPCQIDDEFEELLQEPWMAKHLHIALQHTNKDMLKIMNRRNKVLNDLELFEKIAQKGYAIGTDFIVGHPGEDDAIWRDAIKNLHKFPLTHIHAFTYSKKDGTPSSTMKKEVRGDKAKIRYNELIEIVQEKNRAFRKKTQKPLEVLVESYKDGAYIGLDQFFNKIRVESHVDLRGDWIYLEKYTIKDRYNVAKFE